MQLEQSEQGREEGKDELRDGQGHPGDLSNTIKLYRAYYALLLLIHWTR